MHLMLHFVQLWIKIIPKLFLSLHLEAGTTGFAEFFDRGFNDDFPEWISIRASYKDNPRMSELDIQEAKKVCPTLSFVKSMKQTFNTYEGQIWNFKSRRVRHHSMKFDTHRMDVFAGLDVGYRDPTAFCVIAYDWDEEQYYLLDEYLDAERTTEQHAAEIQEMIDKWDIDYIYIDSAAQQTRFDFAQNYDISTVNAKKVSFRWNRTCSRNS